MGGVIILVEGVSHPASSQLVLRARRSDKLLEIKNYGVEFKL